MWVYLHVQSCEQLGSTGPSTLLTARAQLDYSAGVLPVTKVDRTKDALRNFRPSNQLEAKQYKIYDADKMHGLPVGVQIVGRRLEEEKVLEGMKVVEASLQRRGQVFELLEIDD